VAEAVKSVMIPTVNIIKNDKPTKRNDSPAVEPKKDYCNVPHSVLSNKLTDIHHKITELESKLDRMVLNQQAHNNVFKNTLDAISAYLKPWYKR